VPLLIASALAGAATLALVLRRRYAVARITAVTAALALGRRPVSWPLVNEVTIEDAAGASTALEALLLAVGLAGCLCLPSLVLPPSRGVRMDCCLTTTT